ncbi:MAG TPA: ABC transporter substrate binding protein, partial [Burkholderiaceae bacterium]|nr:ABC transporter substrate binding protein [Burkholderiaceae bacterium]
MGTRRDALLTLPVIWAAARSGRAQQPKAEPPKRIGFLALYSKGQTPWPGPQIPFFFIELGKKGWILGENLSVVEAFADWKREGLAGLAEDLVRKNVDVILCEGVVPALAAARATRTIPIVFYNAIWPLELGLIDSYNRPGRNATGFAFHAGIEVTIKRLTLLRETSPGAKRLSWLWPAGYRSTETLAGGRFDMIPTVEAAAKSLGFE